MPENPYPRSTTRPIVLVVHSGPDYDCIAYIYLALVYFNRSLDDCIVKFVPRGELLASDEPGIPDNPIKLHGDTGGLCDLELGCFDNHEMGPYRSGTSAFYNELMLLEQPVEDWGWEYQAFVDSVDYADDPSGRDMTTERYELLRQYRSQLPDELNGYVDLVAKREGPFWLARMIANIPRHLSDIEKVRRGLIMIDTWFEEWRRQNEIKTFVADHMFTHKRQGVSFTYIEAKKMEDYIYPTGDLRNAIRKSHMLHMLDVYVAICPNPDRDNRLEYAVTLNLQELSGLSEMREHLLATNPELKPQDVFVHRSGAFLYVPIDKCQQSLTDMFQLAQQFVFKIAEASAAA